MTAHDAYGKIKEWFSANIVGLSDRITPEQLALISDLPDASCAFSGDRLAVFREILDGSLQFARDESDGHYTIGEYASVGAGSVTGRAGWVDFTDEEASDFLQGPLAKHINGVKSSFLVRPMRLSDGRYAIFDGDMNVVDEVNRDAGLIEDFITDMWLAHYNEHKRDWWRVRMKGIPLGLGDCQVCVLMSLQERKIDWRAELTSEEVRDAEATLGDKLDDYDYKPD